MIKRIAGGLAACLFVATPAAQNLSRAQEAQATIGQCYAACMNTAQTTGLALYERVDRLSDLVISDEYFDLTEDSQEHLVRLEEDAICGLAQEHVRTLDACSAGCQDLETAYASRQSHARARFRVLYRAETDALRRVGLWRGYADSPAAGGRDFNAACDRYWSEGGDGAAANPVSRLAALPARAGHRVAKLRRHGAGGRDPKKSGAPSDH